jgi:hypothetical protein
MAGTLVICPSNGLCNRLGVVSSFAVLARRSGRQLQVCWTTSRGWSDEKLEDLFESRFMQLSEAGFSFFNAFGVRLHEQLRGRGVGGVDRVWSASGDEAFAAVFDPGAHPVIAYLGYRRCQDLIPPESRRRLLPRFGRDYAAELRRWRPIGPIQRQVDELASKFDAHTVGVHIRRGDAGAHPTLSGQYRRSSDAAFMAAMDRIRKRRPDTSFFLATDCLETEQRFVERYGEAILTNPAKRFVPSIYGAPKENQHDAVVDLFTLARSQRLLGSHYSMFSKTAATLGDIRLQIVVEDSRLAQLRRIASFGRHEAVRRARGLRGSRGVGC